MGEETLAGGVSESEAAVPAVETKPLQSGDILTEKMEVESNGVKDLQDGSKDLTEEETAAGKEEEEDKYGQDGKGEEETKPEARDAGAVKEEKAEGAVKEKDFEKKVEKDADVNGAKDEKAVECMEKTEEKVEKFGEEKIDEKIGEGSKDEDTVEEVERSKEEENVDVGEVSKEAKTVAEDTEEVENPDKLEESNEEKNEEEADESQEEKKEEDHDEGKLQNSKEGKVSKKRSRRRSFGVRVRRDRKKKERKEVEEEEAAKREKTADTKKNKKEEKKKEKDEKEIDRTPIIVNRPVRLRKSVERLVSIIDKDAHKEFNLEKGSGTPLKDIPNVASKLQRKNDDTLKLLHNILFGQRCKAFEIRGHISRFSGFVWHDDEAKKKNKVKEKFDKCTKEKLLEICDMLDIPVSRASIKKEELVTTLIDFLVAPHATTTVLLAEKESSKGQKRKRTASSAKRSGKSQKKSKDSSKGKSRKSQSDPDNDSEEEEEEQPENEEETESGDPDKSDDEMPDQKESEEKDVSEESGDDTRKRKSKAKSSGKKDLAGKAKNKKAVTVEKPKKLTSSGSRVEDADRRVSSKKNEKGIKKSPTPTKSAGKKDAKGKGKSKDSVAKPSDEELRSAIREILEEVDFNTATFTDILKQLAKQFDIDLAPRKSSIKLMIQEELTKLADEADDEEDDEEGEPETEEAGKAEAVAASTEVKAD